VVKGAVTGAAGEREGKAAGLPGEQAVAGPVAEVAVPTHPHERLRLIDRRGRRSGPAQALTGPARASTGPSRDRESCLTAVLRGRELLDGRAAAIAPVAISLLVPARRVDREGLRRAELQVCRETSQTDQR
jgi:hypothetical protein